MKTYFLLLAALALMSFPAAAKEAPVACEAVAKLCPDGSSITPKGPKCKMAACPDGGDADLQGPPEENCNGDDCDSKDTDE
jgi:hypothetical protein